MLQSWGFNLEMGVCKKPGVMLVFALQRVSEVPNTLKRKLKLGLWDDRGREQEFIVDIVSRFRLFKDKLACYQTGVLLNGR